MSLVYWMIKRGDYYRQCEPGKYTLYKVLAARYTEKPTKLLGSERRVRVKLNLSGTTHEKTLLGHWLEYKAKNYPDKKTIRSIRAAYEAGWLDRASR
jgi:hypothetical protein